MTIDYERAFKKLVEQIKTEKKWADEAYSVGRDGFIKDKREFKQKEKKMHECERWVNELRLNECEKSLAYDKGMISAYRSIEELAIKLENGTFDYED